MDALLAWQRELRYDYLKLTLIYPAGLKKSRIYDIKLPIFDEAMARWVILARN
jgi:hypothetical protein